MAGYGVRPCGHGGGCCVPLGVWGLGSRKDWRNLSTNRRGGRDEDIILPVLVLVESKGFRPYNASHTFYSGPRITHCATPPPPPSPLRLRLTRSTGLSLCGSKYVGDMRMCAISWGFHWFEASRSFSRARSKSWYARSFFRCVLLLPATVM